MRDQKKDRKYKLLVPKDKHVKKPPELFMRPKTHEAPPVLDKYPTDMTAIHMKSSYHNGDMEWSVNNSDGSSKKSEMFKDMANIKTIHAMDVRNKENEDEIPKLKIENPRRVPPPPANALAGEKLKISFWTFGLTKTQRLGVLRDLVKRTPVVDLGTLPGTYRQLVKDHIKRSKSKSAKRREASKKEDSSKFQGSTSEHPSKLPVVTPSPQKEPISVSNKHIKHGQISSSSSRPHERKENTDKYSGRYNGTSSSGYSGISRSHISKFDSSWSSKSQGHSRSSSEDISSNRSQKNYEIISGRDANVFKKPQPILDSKSSHESKKTIVKEGQRRVPYITTANSSIVFDPKGKYSMSSTNKDYVQRSSSKDFHKQSEKYSKEHHSTSKVQNSSNSSSRSRSESGSRDRKSSSKEYNPSSRSSSSSGSVSSHKGYGEPSKTPPNISNTGNFRDSNTYSNMKSFSSSHVSKGSRDSGNYPTKVSLSGSYPTKPGSTDICPTKVPSSSGHPTKASGPRNHVAHPTKMSTSNSKDPSSHITSTTSSSSSSSGYRKSSYSSSYYNNTRDSKGSYTPNTSASSKPSHQSSSSREHSSSRKTSGSCSSEEYMSLTKSRPPTHGQREHHSSKNKPPGSGSNSSRLSSTEHSKSSSAGRSYKDPSVKTSSFSPLAASSQQSSHPSSSSSSSYRSGATEKASSALSASTPHNGSEKSSIPTSQGVTTTATELAKHIIQTSSIRAELQNNLKSKKTSSDSVSSQQEKDKSELSRHSTHRRHSASDDRKSHVQLDQRRSSSSPTSKSLSIDLKSKLEHNNRTDKISSSSVDLNTLPTVSSSAEERKTSHISGTIPDFAQNKPTSISPTNQDISRKDQNRDSIIHVTLFHEGTESVEPKGSRSNEGEEKSSGAETRSQSSEFDMSSKSEERSKAKEMSSSSMVNTSRSFIDAFKGTFRFLSPVSTPVKIKIEAMEREQEQRNRVESQDQAIPPLVINKTPLSTVFPTKTLKTRIVEPTMHEVPTGITAEGSKLNLGMKLPVFISSKLSGTDPRQMSIKPSIQVSDTSSIDQEIDDFIGAKSVLADNSKTAAVIGSAIPAIFATATVPTTTNALLSNQPITEETSTTAFDDEEDVDEFQETTEVSQEEEVEEQEEETVEHQEEINEPEHENQPLGIDAESKTQNNNNKQTEEGKDPDYYAIFDFDFHKKQLLADKATVQSKIAETSEVEFIEFLDTVDNDNGNETDNELSKMTKDDDDDDDSDKNLYVSGNQIVPNAVDLQERPDSQADSEATEGIVVYLTFLVSTPSRSKTQTV